jgi:hypothetical protein
LPDKAAMIPDKKDQQGIKKPTDIFRSEWVAVPVAILFVQSLLIAWFILLILDTVEFTLLEKLMRGFFILFMLFVPVFLVMEGFRHSTPTAGFFIPLFVYALAYPLFESMLLHLNLFFNPDVIVPSVIGGIGFGIIGVGSYHFKRDILLSFVLATAGITIIFLVSPGVFLEFQYLVSGISQLAGRFIRF